MKDGHFKTCFLKLLKPPAFTNVIFLFLPSSREKKGFLFLPNLETKPIIASFCGHTYTHLILLLLLIDSENNFLNIKILMGFPMHKIHINVASYR